MSIEGSFESLTMKVKYININGNVLRKFVWITSTCETTANVLNT